MNPPTITPSKDLPLGEAVNQALQPFLDSFVASAASIVDNSGNITELYSSVVRPGGNTEGDVPIDAVAAVIACEEKLTIESLRTAYERVRRVKALPKAQGMNSDREMIAGLIVARDSQLPLEQISDEMGRLNQNIPSQHWPDAVAVLSKGIINYAGQVPVTSHKGGDFFLPAPSLVGRSSVPSIYVQRIIRAAGNQTFNKIVSLVLVRIKIFDPNANVPNFQDFTRSIPSHGVMTEAYQFDLGYALRAMTVEQAVTAQLPREWFDVMSGKEVLGSVQFLPWQDGGVLAVRGKFPIDILLVFLRAIKPDISANHLQSFRSPDLQVSFVLPITWQDFVQMLQFFERRSNMRVQRHDPKVVVQKSGDEGATTPFVARLMLGILKLREAVHADNQSRLAFDKLYEPVLSGLRNAREASREIDRIWKDHQGKVASGSIARVERGTIYVDEHIDRPTGKELESFLNTAVRVIKHQMQALAQHHGVSIGFLFKKDSTFQAAVKELQKSDVTLASYLDETRKWSEPLVLMRNDLEHEIPPSLKVSYSEENGSVRAKEPTINSVPVTVFTRQTLDRICCFVEELTAYCLRKNFPPGVEIMEQPLAEREKSAPLRFHLAVVGGGLPPWVLSAHQREFDQS